MGGCKGGSANGTPRAPHDWSHGPHPPMYGRMGAPALCVYNTHTHSRGMTYTCRRGQNITSLCTDKNDNIYAVNGNPEIYIFHGSNPNPHTIVPTGIKPRQICVTKTGVMITSTCNTTPIRVTVFDREGHVGSSITASDDDEYLYAAVDSVDRVLVARVRYGSDVFRLTRYTLQGTTLIKQMTFKALKLHHQCTIYGYGRTWQV